MSKTKERTTAGQDAGVPQQFPLGGPVSPPRVAARRRRPGVIALCLTLIAGGGAAGAVLFLESGERTQVVTVVRPVPVGQRVSEQDLGKASVALDPAVKAVQASDMDNVVGKRAAVELTPGSLLSTSQVTDKSLIEAGESLVPVGLKPEQVPATTLSPGQKVQIVAVPGPDEEVEQQQPSTIPARVVKVGNPAPGTGVVVVDVAASGTDAPTLAAWVSTGNVRLLVDAQGGS
ncbi:SAF domain-containing protein [Streptomyces sp. 8N706]|uniref:SAF domain-containing protein n=1 Tax=Streptomyces sp. 8N706 TaxID=3457416 RepID=UPI003FD41A62